MATRRKQKRPAEERRNEPARILTSASFGAFETELKLSFKRAFQFSWDPVEESEDEAQRRRAFLPAVRAAHLAPAGPEKALELMKDCYDLSFRLGVYLRPDDLQRDELMRITALIEQVGNDFTRLLGPSTSSKSKNNLRSESPGATEVLDRWLRIEHGLQTEAASAMPNPVATEMARLRDVGLRTIEQVKAARTALGRLALGGRNPIATAQRVKDLKHIGASMDQISLELATFSEKCTAPTDEETKFNAYFERLMEALQVQISDQRFGHSWSEVPESALVMPRDLPARRGAVLRWICTRDPDFYPLLPSAARRDHGAPALVGGKGRVNVVLRGVTAALVLLKLVEETPRSTLSEGGVDAVTVISKISRLGARSRFEGRYSNPRRHLGARVRSPFPVVT